VDAPLMRPLAHSSVGNIMIGAFAEEEGDIP
jgi:hypothetical protein